MLPEHATKPKHVRVGYTIVRYDNIYCVIITERGTPHRLHLFAIDGASHNSRLHWRPTENLHNSDTVLRHSTTAYAKPIASLASPHIALLGPPTLYYGRHGIPFPRERRRRRSSNLSKSYLLFTGRNLVLFPPHAVLVGPAGLLD